MRASALLLILASPPDAGASGVTSPSSPAGLASYAVANGTSSAHEFCGDFSDSAFEATARREQAFLEDHQHLHKLVLDLAPAMRAQEKMLRSAQGMRRDVCKLVHAVEADAEKLMAARLPDGQCPLYDEMLSRLSTMHTRLGEVAAVAHEEMKKFTELDTAGMVEDVGRIRALHTSGYLTTDQNTAIHLESFAVWAHGNPGTLLRRFLNGVTQEISALKAKQESLATNYATIKARKDKCGTAGVAPPRAAPKAKRRR